MCTCTCACMCACIHACKSVCVAVCIRVCKSVCVAVCIRACKSVCVAVCRRACKSVCVAVCRRACMCPPLHYFALCLPPVTCQRLYVSEVSGCPLKWTYLTEEAGYVQRRTQEAVLGNLFKVSIGFTTQPMIHPAHFELGFGMELRQCSIVHNFTLTKTPGKEYYIYAHTWMDVNEMMKVRHSPDCHGNLTIVTQNIWHFSHTEESRYVWRIKELGTVSPN